MSAFFQGLVGDASSRCGQRGLRSHTADTRPRDCEMESTHKDLFRLPVCSSSVIRIDRVWTAKASIIVIPGKGGKPFSPLGLLSLGFDILMIKVTIKGLTIVSYLLLSPVVIDMNKEGLEMVKEYQ